MRREQSGWRCLVLENEWSSVKRDENCRAKTSSVLIGLLVATGREVKCDVPDSLDIVCGNGFLNR